MRAQEIIYLGEGRDPHGNGQFWGIVRPIEKHWESVLRQLTQKIINNDGSGTVGSRLQCSKLVNVTLH